MAKFVLLVQSGITAKCGYTRAGAPIAMKLRSGEPALRELAILQMLQQYLPARLGDGLASDGCRLLPSPQPLHNFQEVSCVRISSTTH